MPFRGHDESVDSSNKGVYLEFLDFLAASGDSILNEHFQTAASNATYLSPTIENQMIEIVGHSIRDVVITNIKQISWNLQHFDGRNNGCLSSGTGFNNGAFCQLGNIGCEQCSSRASSCCCGS